MRQQRDAADLGEVDVQQVALRLAADRLDALHARFRDFVRQPDAGALRQRAEALESVRLELGVGEQRLVFALAHRAGRNGVLEDALEPVGERGETRLAHDHRTSKSR